MAELPSGTVTFLFTDLEGSTRLWEEHPEAMPGALVRHDEILRCAVEAHDGVVFSEMGDGMAAVSASPLGAVAAAVDAQRRLGDESWGEVGALRARIGLHAGEGALRADGHYVNAPLNRCARLMAVAHGGQVLLSDSVAALVRDALAPPVAIVDLGEHRLRDLAQPVRVYQLTHPELRSDFPSLRTVDEVRGSLPAQVTEFVGRRGELESIVKAVQRSRLVTLTGAGGVGKTRLALAVAEIVGAQFPDGAWFVDLAPIDDATFIPTEIATSMLLAEAARGTREESLVGALKHRHALLVLDNCEHLIDTVAQLVDLVLRRCPEMTVIATTQEVLGIDGEVAVAVRPLSEHDAERLFVERATAVREGFDLSVEGRAIVAELCRRLDGMPLAIELAAARVASMTPAAILEHVDERFRLLGQGRRTARRRHQTLRAAVDWSYELLDPLDQRAFDRLSVFAGRFSIDAAAAVLAAEGLDPVAVLDVVGNLVAKSMVQFDDDGRYRLLETLRDYGLERLAARSVLEASQHAHAAYYCAFVEDAAPHLRGPDDELWSARLEDEYSNVRSALAFAREHEPDTFVRMVFALAIYWRLERHYREGLAWITDAYTVASDARGTDAAETWAAGAVMAINLNRPEEGLTLAQHSLDRSAEDQEAPRVVALVTRGLAQMVQDQTEEAAQQGREAVALAREQDDPFDLAWTLANVGIQYSMNHDDPWGTELADESLDVARALGNSYLLSFGLQAVGLTRYRTDPAGAIGLLETGFAGTRRLHAHVRSMKAFAHLAVNDERGAATELLIALPELQQLGEEYYLAMSLVGPATIFRRRGRPELAIQILAMNQRLRDEGRILGAHHDLERQASLRSRLESEVDPASFATNWATGSAMTIDAMTTVVLQELAPIASVTT